jgi:hypothetical protein
MAVFVNETSALRTAPLHVDVEARDAIAPEQAAESGGEP